MAADALRVLRDDFNSTSPGDANAVRAVLARVDDLIDAIEDADKALSRLPHPSMADAAAKMAHLFYVSGRGWRRYLAESPFGSRSDEVRSAVIVSAAPVLEILSGMLQARDVPRVTQRGDGGYGLPCSACGADAV